MRVSATRFYFESTPHLGCRLTRHPLEELESALETNPFPALPAIDQDSDKSY